MGFEDLVEEDVIELLQLHKEDLSNKELMQLEQQQDAVEEGSEEASPTLHDLTTK